MHLKIYGAQRERMKASHPLQLSRVLLDEAMLVATCWRRPAFTNYVGVNRPFGLETEPVRDLYFMHDVECVVKFRSSSVAVRWPNAEVGWS